MNGRKVFGYSEIARLYPSHRTESKWVEEKTLFSMNFFLLVDRPQNFSSLDLREPVTFFPPMEIQICSFVKALFIHLPVLWAAFRAFFARLSTLMLIRSLSKQSCYPFVSLACDYTYLYQMQNSWTVTRFLKMRRILACDWLVGNGRRGTLSSEGVALRYWVCPCSLY